jgi:hypothetical protein
VLALTGVDHICCPPGLPMISHPAELISHADFVMFLRGHLEVWSPIGKMVEDEVAARWFTEMVVETGAPTAVFEEEGKDAYRLLGCGAFEMLFTGDDPVVYVSVKCFVLGQRIVCRTKTGVESAVYALIFCLDFPLVPFALHRSIGLQICRHQSGCPRAIQYHIHRVQISYHSRRMCCPTLKDVAGVGSQS